MKKLFSKMDIPLLITTILFSIFGLMMIYSASSVTAVIRYNRPSYYFFLKQLIIMVGAYLLGFIFILRFPTKHYQKVMWPCIIFIIFSLIFLFVKGKIINKVISWYRLGFFSFQPSEYAKAILIIFFACFYDKLNKKKVNNIYIYLIPLIIGIIIIGLIIMQPDFGGAVIVGGIILMIFISIPMVKNNILKIVKVLGIGIIIGGVVLIYSGQEILNSTQLNRLHFKNPCARYTEESGYQVCNGFIAINNGGMLGVGLGKSTQKYLYLPESHTDMIFPIIVEELGLITGIIIIIAYFYMLYRILKIARASENLRCSILAYGTFWYLTLHILVNLMGILALIPLTGLPLPLLSYGGSYLVNVIGMLFIVQRVNIENNINKTNREIRAL